VVGLPFYFYLVKQDQDAKERARLELEAKCSAYEAQTEDALKNQYKNLVLWNRLMLASKESITQFMMVRADIEEAQTNADRLVTEKDKVSEAFKQACGEERRRLWWEQNLERIKREVDPKGIVDVSITPATD
jgi:hypothetical protein